VRDAPFVYRTLRGATVLFKPLEQFFTCAHVVEQYGTVNSDNAPGCLPYYLVRDFHLTLFSSHARNAVPDTNPIMLAARVATQPFGVVGSFTFGMLFFDDCDATMLRRLLFVLCLSACAPSRKPAP